VALTSTSKAGLPLLLCVAWCVWRRLNHTGNSNTPSTHVLRLQ